MFASELADSPWDGWSSLCWHVKRVWDFRAFLFSRLTNTSVFCCCDFWVHNGLLTTSPNNCCFTCSSRRLCLMSLFASWTANFSLSSDTTENIPELLRLGSSLPTRFLWPLDAFSFSIIIGRGWENLRAKFSGTAGTFLLNWSCSKCKKTLMLYRTLYTGDATLSWWHCLGFVLNTVLTAHQCFHSC